MKMRFGLVAEVLAAAGVTYLAASALAAHRLARPKRRFTYGVGPWMYGMDTRDVVFPASLDGVRISAWYLPNPTARRALVLVHGKDVCRGMELYGRFIELAQALHRRGFAILMPDLRGHGMSGAGTYSFGLRERRDITGAVNWLRAQGFDPAAVGLLGVSLGSSAVLGAAADGIGVGAVVSDSGFARIEPVIRANWRRESHLPNLMLPGVRQAVRWLFGYDLASSAPVDEVWKIRAPLLVMHGGQDEMIPVEHARLLAASAPDAELFIVPEAIHAGLYGIDPQAYTQRVGDFFDRCLGLKNRSVSI